MENCHHKVYVGVDVHRHEHRVAIMPIAFLHRSGSKWKQAKFLTIKNDSGSFKRLDAAIREHLVYPDEAVIAIDHTGGHYSEPLVWFLQRQQYNKLATQCTNRLHCERHLLL